MAAVRRGGVREFVRVVRNWVREFSPKRRQMMNELYASELEFDRERGVDTAGIVSPYDLGPVKGDRDRAGRYEGVLPDRLRAVIDALITDPTQWHFVDLGSGKGKALMVAAEYPFRSVVGVEFAESLHVVAVENLKKDRGPRRCTDVSCVVGDASEFKYPDGPAVILFNNPFQGPPFERVLDAVAAHPHRVFFLYGQYNPDSLHLPGPRGLVLVQKWWDYIAYEHRPTGANAQLAQAAAGQA